MRKIDFCFLSLKKELRDFLTNKVSICIFLLAGLFVVFLPFFMDKIPFGVEEIKEIDRQKTYVLLDFVVCIFVMSQFLYDNMKNDFTGGTCFFLLNLSADGFSYFFGKGLLAFLMGTVCVFLRIEDFLLIFSWLDFIWIFLFFIFVINLICFFSMLFFTPNTNFIAFLLIFLLPLFLLVIFLNVKWLFLKVIFLLVMIWTAEKWKKNVFYSKRFRIKLA